MKACIFCSGTIEDYSFMNQFARADLIICADGGATHCRRMEIIPHLIVGDLDSISNEDLEYFRQNSVKILEYPVSKDYTDSEIAIAKAMESGADEIIILGALGGRMDHAVANLFLLKKILEKGLSGKIVTEKDEVYLMDERLNLRTVPGAKISLIPMSGDVEGVWTKGLLYALSGETLSFGSSRGVSNVFQGEEAAITIQKGILMVIVSKE